MLELIRSGGWLMAPILLCSGLSLAIVIERFLSLRKPGVSPEFLIPQIKRWAEQGVLDPERIRAVEQTSPLGRILAAGLRCADRDRDIMKESIEESGRHVVLQLDRYLNTLGTIAAVTPLLGLLGTVVGMIDVFAAITTAGVGNAQELSGGISKALITTASGLVVAIPSLIFFRYFTGRVEELTVEMEQQALILVEIIHGDRPDDGS
ncbi:MAG: MotA/TolQ/ExbB proton channel family protein [Gammaproteobacteria bacterium]|nr:MotA/TolQ/ExbB proton channel family protein [Gammaproteobacteria bacterium]